MKSINSSFTPPPFCLISRLFSLCIYFLLELLFPLPEKNSKKVNIPAARAGPRTSKTKPFFICSSYCFSPHSFLFTKQGHLHPYPQGTNLPPKLLGGSRRVPKNPTAVVLGVWPHRDKWALVWLWPGSSNRVTHGEWLLPRLVLLKSRPKFLSFFISFSSHSLSLLFFFLQNKTKFIFPFPLYFWMPGVMDIVIIILNYLLCNTFFSLEQNHNDPPPLKKKKYILHIVSVTFFELWKWQVNEWKYYWMSEKNIYKKRNYEMECEATTNFSYSFLKNNDW